MATMSVRGLDDGVVRHLKERARLEGKSVNGLVVQILSGDGGASANAAARRPRRDLSALAGTWTEAEARAFERATSTTRTIDPEVWR